MLSLNNELLRGNPEYSIKTEQLKVYRKKQFDLTVGKNTSVSETQVQLLLRNTIITKTICIRTE